MEKNPVTIGRFFSCCCSGRKNLTCFYRPIDGHRRHSIPGRRRVARCSISGPAYENWCRGDKRAVNSTIYQANPSLTKVTLNENLIEEKFF